MSMIDFVANSKSEGSWCSTSESHVTKMARWVAWGAAMHGMASSLSACCCDDGHGARRSSGSKRETWAGKGLQPVAWGGRRRRGPRCSARRWVAHPAGQGQAGHPVVVGKNGDEEAEGGDPNPDLWATALIEAWLRGNADPERAQQCRHRRAFWLAEAWLTG